MKKIAIALGAAASLLSGIELGDGWNFSGDVRTGWVEYDYANPNGDANIAKGHKDSSGWYIIPKLSISSPILNGFSAKLTGAAVTDFGINDSSKESRTFANMPDEGSYAILQEAFVEYNTKEHHAMIGRKEYSSPMIDKDDYYLLADSFGMMDYSYSGFTNLVLGAGYFYTMAGPWDASGETRNPSSPNYSSRNNGTHFQTMSEASFVNDADKNNADNSGIVFVRADYDDKTHQIQAWNYYATDLYNTLFLQYDFKNRADTLSYDFGIQVIDFQEVGKLKSHNFTNIDHTLYSVRFDGTFDSGFGFATGATKFNDGEGQGSTLGAWGGYPYFANGMIFHFFEAGSLQNAASYKLQGSYDFAKSGIKGLVIALRFTHFALDSKYSHDTSGAGQNSMDLQGLRVSYNADNGAYFTGTYEQYQLDGEKDTYGLRLIGGYRF